MARARGVNHVVHILATVFLCGWWLPIWGLMCITTTPDWRCTRCGYRCSGPDNPNKIFGWVLLGVMGVMFCGIAGFCLLGMIGAATQPVTVPTNGGTLAAYRPETPSSDPELDEVAKLPVHEPVRPHPTRSESRPTITSPPTAQKPETPVTPKPQPEPKPEKPLPKLPTVILKPLKGGYILLGQSALVVNESAKNQELMMKWEKEGKVKLLREATEVELVERDRKTSRVRLSGVEWVLDSFWVSEQK